MSRIPIQLTINGAISRHEVEPRLLLSDFIRENLGLTGTHVGCEHGICGACTVLIGGLTVRSCLMFAVQAEGLDITTIEGLKGEGDELHPIQQAFHRHHGLQCGFCTPAFLLTTKMLIEKGAASDQASIREAISGVICRCTGYVNIVAAIADAIAAADAQHGR